MEDLKSIDFLDKESKFHDIEFIVGPQDAQQNLCANRFMLAARSNVFKRMFHGNLHEANSDEAIRIEDVAPIGFHVCTGIYVYLTHIFHTFLDLIGVYIYR